MMGCNSRSEKSLGELCLKFLKHFGAKNHSNSSSNSSEEKNVINLEDCVTYLAIERRRIYDIVNILESFEMIKRQQKNQYILSPPEMIKKRIEGLEVSIRYAHV